MMTTVSGTTSAAPSVYPDAGAEMANGTAASAAPSASDPFTELATLLLNTDFLRAKVDHQDLVAARQAQANALNAEISKLHEAASDMRTGAWIEAGVSTLGTLTDSDYLKSLIKPASTEFGEAPAADANADAKQAEKEGALAASRAEEAEHVLNRTDGNEDRTLEALDKILDSRAQGNLAIIANV